MLLITALYHIVLRVNSQGSIARFYCDVLGCIGKREVEELGLVQLRASDSLVDLVALHRELANSGALAPSHGGHNMDNFCLSVSAVLKHKLCAFLASRFIQHSAMVKR